MKAPIKIRYRLMGEDWAEEVCFCDSEDTIRTLDNVAELLFPIFKKRHLERNVVHMIMKQAFFNQLAYDCALECVDIGESFEMMKKFNILWFHRYYIPVYFNSRKEPVPEEPGVPDDLMIMF